MIEPGRSPAASPAPGRADRALLAWVAAGGLGWAILPWYAIEGGIFDLRWLAGYPVDAGVAPALLQVALHRRLWLLPPALILLLPLLVLRRARGDPGRARVLLAAGGAGTAWIVLQGVAIGIQGWSWGFLEATFGALGDRQFGMGAGGLLTVSFTLLSSLYPPDRRGAVMGMASGVWGLASVLGPLIGGACAGAWNVRSTAPECTQGGP